MKILLAIVGFVLGNIFGIAILALYSTLANSQMGNPFLLSTSLGIICAIVGFNMKKIMSKGKKIYIFVSIIIVLSLWLKLEFYSKDYYAADNFTDDRYELQAARFIESRHIRERFDNIYPWIIPFSLMM